MIKPRLLDLMCGAGGCSVGYARAGFDVEGVDIYPNKFYPYTFHEQEARYFLEENWKKYDAFAASPPCQGHSSTKYLHAGHETIPDQVGSTREALLATGKPWIMENVPEAPLLNPVTLCGAMKEIQEIYPLRVYRHRNFESNVALVQPEHVKHPEPVMLNGRTFEPGRWVTVAGHFGGIEIAKTAMGIDWVQSGRLMAQAIPPAYTEYLGRQLMQQFI